MKQAKPKVHNVYFRTVSLSNRKSCPVCHERLDGRDIWSMGEYIRAKWHTVEYFCEACYVPRVLPLILAHQRSCPCTVQCVSYRGITLPEWLTVG